MFRFKMNPARNFRKVFESPRELNPAGNPRRKRGGIVSSGILLGLGALLLVVSVIIGTDISDRSGAVRGQEHQLVLAATTSIRWAGYTTTTYNGALGDLFNRRGIRAGADICQANYSGSVWADASALLKLGTSYPWTNSVWLADFYGDPTADCYHYTDFSNTRYGTCADTKSVYPGAQSVCACNEAKYLPCVYIP